jgi:hypothetical protein
MLIGARCSLYIGSVLDYSCVGKWSPVCSWGLKPEGQLGAPLLSLREPEQLPGPVAPGSCKTGTKEILL